MSVAGDSDSSSSSDSNSPMAQWEEKKSELECPFNWKTPLMSDDEVHNVVTVNKKCVPMIWHEIVFNVKLAYTYCARDRLELCPPLIVEAYMRLLLPSSDKDDSLVRDYVDALRHLVDATWLFVCVATYRDDEEVVRDLLTDLMAKITPRSRLCSKQRAALVAIRGQMDGYSNDLAGRVSYTQQAIKMNPDEGHWYTQLAWAIRHYEPDVDDPSFPFRSWHRFDKVLHLEKVAIGAASEGFEKRKTVESYGEQSRSLQDQGFNSDALDLVKEAVKKFPDSAWVLADAAALVTDLPKPQRSLSQALRWLSRALECPRGDCPAVRYQMATLLMMRGDYVEALPHLESAAPAIPEASKLIEALHVLRYHPPPNLRQFAGPNFFGGSTRGGVTFFGQGGPGYVPSRSGRDKGYRKL